MEGGIVSMLQVDIPLPALISLAHKMSTEEKDRCHRFAKDSTGKFRVHKKWNPKYSSAGDLSFELFR
jgi:hypothetical protein